jgi:heme exporter protein C
LPSDGSNSAGAVWAILRKECRSEWRTRYGLNAALLFALTTLTAVSFAVGRLGNRTDVLAALLWIVLLFAALASLSHAFVREVEGRTMTLLRLVASPTAIAIGKLLFNLLFLFVLEAVTVPLFLLLMGGPPPHWGAFLSLLVLGSLALAGSATLVGAVIAQTRGRGALFAGVSFPLLLPMLAAARWAGSCACWPPTRPPCWGRAFCFTITSGRISLMWRGLLLVWIAAALVAGFVWAPLVPGLGETTRVLYFHIPAAWVTVVALAWSMVHSLLYLSRRRIEYDDQAAGSAELGLLFCIVATVSGSLWAKAVWHSYWNWDPRETSIFFLLLIYGAYLALRSAVEGEERRARLSAIYSAAAFVAVPFLMFIVPRIYFSLHPDPIINTSGKMQMDPRIRISFLAMLLGFTALFFWMLSLRVKLVRLERRALRAAPAGGDR